MVWGIGYAFDMPGKGDPVSFWVDLSHGEALGTFDMKYRSRFHLAGKEFTAADISVGYGLHVMGLLGLADRLDPSLEDYLARLRERPAFQRAAAAAIARRVRQRWPRFPPSLGAP